EDYVAALDPYAPLLANRLRTRFYMQRMDYDAALQAVQQPAAQYHRPFAPGAAEQLVNNLRQIRVPGQNYTQAGQYLGPVQVQVLCYQLWNNLQDRPGAAITTQDVAGSADVQVVLGDFYTQTLAAVVAETGVSEARLRTWFETQLITAAGTRGMAYQGTADTAGLPNQVVKALADRFL